jgi:hypothetical protein
MRAADDEAEDDVRRELPELEAEESEESPSSDSSDELASE